MRKIIGRKLRAFIFSGNENSEYFYGKFQGGRNLSLLKRLLIILLDLRTFKDFLLFHKNPVIMNTFGRAEKKDNKNLNSKEQKILQTLNEEGIVFLEEYFKDEVDSLVKDNVEDGKSSSNNYLFYHEIKQTDEFFQILNASSLLNIASEYYGTKAFYRYRPNITFTNPSRDDFDSRMKMSDPTNDNFSDDWHVDSVYNLQYHILLKDVSSDDSRMLFAQGRSVDFFDRFCGYASEEYVRKNFSITECCGLKGTVILFDGSKHWHRLFPVKGKKRFTTSVLFSRGQQVAPADMYSEPLMISELGNSTKSACKFVL